MTQSEFVAKFAAEAGIDSKNRAREILKALGVSITTAVAAGDTVDIPGVGKVGRSHRGERQARNLHTGESITIPARHVPSFKAAKAFKDAVA